MHWADVVAQRLVERGGAQVLATAITPSGPIHVGNMREVLTTEAVHRALRDASAPSELLYIADSYDPLRKVYPFLDTEAYTPFVGRPLAEVPPPGSDGHPTTTGPHATYAERFLAPFLAALERLGVQPRVLDAYTMYREGAYRESILTALDATAEAQRIIETVSKRRLPKDWMPFNVQCASCRRLTGTRAVRYERPVIAYACACGFEGEMDVTEPGAGKLPWRVDWPARWSFLGVTFEAAGKDHHAAGGSWDTGVALARNVFRIEPPMGLQYEFIHMKGQGAMHSSTGTGIPAERMLAITPPEVLRFLILRTDPRKHIDFDPGLGILSLVDDYDRFERVALGAEEAQLGIKDADRVHALAQPHDAPVRLGVQVPYRHLVTVVQMSQDDDEALRILRRSGELPKDVSPEDEERLVGRLHCVREWLASFAPEDLRFEVQEEIPDVEVTAAERGVYRELTAGLKNVSPDSWHGKEIHDAVYAVAERTGTPAKAVFRLVYLAILGRERGPRAGHFLSSLERDFVITRFEKIAETTAQHLPGEGRA